MFNNNEKATKRLSAVCLSLFMAVIFGSTHVQSQIANIPEPGSQAVVVLGEIEHVFVDDMDDMWSAGWIVADGTAVRIPSGLLIDLPMNRLTIRDIMAGASPECAANGESGLASTDQCLRNKGLQGGGAQILANRQDDGQIIAGDVFLNKSMTGNVAGGIVPPTVGGSVSFIDYEQGYFVVNGVINERPFADGGTDRKGVICRINDPDMVQTIQNGLGCIDGMPNCSADPRFTIDPGSYSFAFTTGVPSCIPSTNNSFGARDTNSGSGNNNGGADAQTGEGDAFCPMWNRAFTGPLTRTVPDSRRFVPMIVGDPISLEGNFEVVDGTRFFSAYAACVQLGLRTKREGNQPDFMTWDEVECDVPPFDNARIKSLAIAFTSIDDVHIDAYRLHIDPISGEGIEYIWGTSQGNLGARFNGIAPNAGHITKFGYDVDFLLGAPSAHGPCLNLINGGHNLCPQGGTMEEEVALMAPAAREVIGKTHHSYTIPDGVFPRDILGNPAQHGEYVAGAGLGHPEFVEVNLDKTGYPFIFEGIPWNLDRRLGPGGCDEAIGCEDLPIGSLPLSPFPSAGDPDWVVHSIGNGIPPFAAERLTAYEPFGPNDFMDPYVDASPPGPGLPVGMDGLTGEHCDIANNVPLAAGDAVAATEDSPTLISNTLLLSNDDDPDLDVLTVFHYEGTSLEGGTVTPSGDGVIYQSAPDFHGNDEFHYSVSDGHGGISKGLVSIVVSPQMDAPVANDDFLTTGLGPFMFTEDLLLGNDSDVDGDAISLQAINMIDAATSAGLMENDGAGNWTFTPAGAGASTWEYVISDSTGLLASALVTFHAGNEAPVTQTDTVLTDEDVAIEIDVLANDTDPEGDPLAVSDFTAAGFGSVELLPSGVLLYTPDLDQNGNDSFTYTVTDGKGTFSTGDVIVSVTAINDAPRLGADIAVTLEDQAVEINVLANDYDPEGHAMTVSLPIVNAFNGAVSLLQGGVLRFVPFPDMSVGVADNFMYIVTDSQGAVSTAMVSIEVTPVNDAPIANPDTAVTLEDVPTVINVLANDGDVDNDLLRVQSVDIPADFPATVNWGANGSITIQPDPNYNDVLPRVFTYVLSDGFLTDTGQVSLQVISINDAPVAVNDLGNQVAEDSTVSIDVLANDTDVDDGDILQLAAVTNGLLGLATIELGGTISYTPFPNANGFDSFTYTVTDNNGGQASATVEVEILPVNDAPVAGTLPIFPLPEDSLKTISALTILQGATDADMDELVLTNVGEPSHGTVDINVDGQGIISSILYTPNPNFFGIDEFVYEVHDLSLHGAGTIRLNVLPVNDMPVANNDFGIVVESGSSIDIAPLLNDEDVDNDELFLLGIISGPFHGSMETHPDGTLTYNADDNYEGEDSMIYRISDNHGGMATASILIDVTAQTSAAASMIRSDANTDGQLDVSDPVETVLHLFQGRGVACLAALDSNDDDQIDIADVVFTLNTLFTNGQVPSAPYPFCGEDPTGNLLPCDGFGLCD